MVKNIEVHNNYLNLALAEAHNALNEVPVGAVLVKDNQVVATAYNQKESANDPTAHAEIIAIRKACKLLKNWRLEGTILYVTLEPCPMCATAIINSRISTVCFGASDLLYGALGSVMDMRAIFNSNLNVIAGIKEQECTQLLKDFFYEKRTK